MQQPQTPFFPTLIDIKVAPLNAGPHGGWSAPLHGPHGGWF